MTEKQDLIETRGLLPKSFSPCSPVRVSGNTAIFSSCRYPRLGILLKSSASGFFADIIYFQGNAESQELENVFVVASCSSYGSEHSAPGNDGSYTWELTQEMSEKIERLISNPENDITQDIELIREMVFEYRKF